MEVWRLDEAAFGSFVAALPPPMTIGKVRLADGSWVCGIGYEPAALVGAADISGYGGWRRYRAARSSTFDIGAHCDSCRPAI